jgi:hypothetical protein
MINNTVFPPSLQTDKNANWVAALSCAHLQNKTFCQCREPASPLSIKRYGGRDNRNQYGLARWPGTGLNHHVDCHFFSEDEGNGSAGGTKPPFDELESGLVRVHLALSMSSSQESVLVKPSTNDAPNRPGTTRRTASQILLLNRLWREARLNVHDRREKNWFKACYALQKQAEKYIINKSGDTLLENMLFAGVAGDKMSAAHNEAVIASIQKKPRRLFIVGRMREFKQDKKTILFPFKDWTLVPKILVDCNQIGEFLNGREFFRNILNGNQPGNILTLACIELTAPKSVWWKTVSLTGIATTTGMIPVESSFEIEFCQHLIGQGRTFLKPMSLDEDSDGTQRPDFLLLDTARRIPCEVWGMQTADYLKDKAARIERYHQKGELLVSWSANPREPFPILPPLAA